MTKIKTHTPKEGARIELRIWGDNLPIESDLSEAFVPHLEHVTRMCGEGYNSGEICDERFSGWWDVRADGEDQRVKDAAPELLAVCERVLLAIEWSTSDERMTPREQARALRAAIAKATGGV